MPTLAIATPRTAVHRHRGRLRVARDGQVLGDFKLHDVDRLVVATGVQVTSSALALLASRDVPVSFVRQDGRLLATLEPTGRPRWRRIVSQHRVWTDPARRLAAAQQLVGDKTDAMLGVLAGALSNRPDPRLRAARNQLRQQRDRCTQAATIAALRGCEGRLARIYWSVFGALLRGELPWTRRTRRPPLDPPSALLGYAYALLAAEATAAIAEAGFDPALGFYHEPRPGRPALALDLMEPWRHRLVDRLVIRMINLRQFLPADFRPGPNRGTWLTPPAAARLRAAFEQRLNRPAKADGNPSGCLRDAFRRDIRHRLRLCYSPDRLAAATERTPADGEPTGRDCLRHA